jgi:hydrogenase maturation protease
MTENKRILLYGYGNPGRQDDGLGNQFIEMMEEWITKNNIEGIELDSNYQLNIEDADAISDKDIVVFIDASVEDINDFYIDKVDPSNAKVEFTMHAVSVGFVVSLCNQLYDKYPEVYLLHIKAYEFDFGEGLTEKATKNLDKAVVFMQNKLANKEKFVD